MWKTETTTETVAPTLPADEYEIMVSQASLLLPNVPCEAKPPVGKRWHLWRTDRLISEHGVVSVVFVWVRRKSTGDIGDQGPDGAGLGEVKGSEQWQDH